MKPLPLLLALCFLTAGPVAGQTQDTSLAESLDRVVQPLLDLDVFSGVVLVARGDSVLATRAYGLADRAFGIPIAADHAFRVASISKSFTRALVGVLVERGSLALDDPLTRWLPQFPSADRITVGLLLDHRAGVPHVNSLPYDEESPVPNTLEQLVDSIARMPLDFEPGTDRRYSNGGYAILGLVLEKAAGMSFERLLEEGILAPLDLARTGHEADGEIVPLLARGYEPSPEAFGRARHAPFQEMATKTGGGSLASTASDLHRWAYAVGRAPILRPEMWSELFPEPDFFETGRSPGYNAAVARMGEWIAIVLANNYAAGAAADVAASAIALARGDQPEPLPVVAPTALLPDVRDAAVGTYALPPGMYPVPEVSIETRGAELVAALAGIPFDVLVPQGDRSFLARALWSRVTFDPPVEGRSPGIEVQPLYRSESFHADRVEGGRP